MTKKKTETPKTGRARYSDYEFAKGWPSVSEVCGSLAKPFLYFWYGEMGWEEANRINQQSKKVGNMVDNYISKYFGETVEDKEVVLDTDSKKFYDQAVENFHIFIKGHEVKSIMGQVVVYSKLHKYIGTFDRLLTVDGKLVLGDWKATNSLGDEYLMQLEGYFRALLEMQAMNEIELPNLEWHDQPMWLVQFPKKEVMNFDRHIVKFTPNENRFNKFLHLVDYIHADKADNVKLKDILKQKGETKNE